MFEISKRYVWLAAIAAMVFGSVAFLGRTAVASIDDGNIGHVAILQQSGDDAGHTQVAFFGAGSTSGCGQMVMTPNHAGMGHVFTASTTGNNFEGMQFMAALLPQDQMARAGTGTTFFDNGTMAVMNRETWQMETNSGGHGHRLSQARQAQGHQVIQQMAQLKEHYSRRA